MTNYPSGGDLWFPPAIPGGSPVPQAASLGGLFWNGWIGSSPYAHRNSRQYLSHSQFSLAITVSCCICNNLLLIFAQFSFIFCILCFEYNFEQYYDPIQSITVKFLHQQFRTYRLEVKLHTLSLNALVWMKCCFFCFFYFSGTFFTLVCLIAAGEYISFFILQTSAKSLEHSHASREKQRNIWCIFMTFPAFLITPIFCHYQSSCSKCLLSSVSQCHIVRAFWIFQRRQTCWKGNVLRLMCTNLEDSGYPPKLSCSSLSWNTKNSFSYFKSDSFKYNRIKIIVKMTTITFPPEMWFFFSAESQYVCTHTHPDPERMIGEGPHIPQGQNIWFPCRRSQDQIPGIST